MKFLKRAFFGPTTEELRSYAKYLREGAEHYGLDHFPIILNELEVCACGHSTFVFMQPRNVCGECWKAWLNQIIEALSFWPECLEIVQACKNAGEYPFEEGITVDLDKASIADNERLAGAGIKNPVAAVEQQLTLLFVRENVADKMEVRRKGNLLYICSPSW